MKPPINPTYEEANNDAQGKVFNTVAPQETAEGVYAPPPVPNPNGAADAGKHCRHSQSGSDMGMQMRYGKYRTVLHKLRFAAGMGLRVRRKKYRKILPGMRSEAFVRGREQHET